VDERPSFRRREDVRRLVLVSLAPWAYFALALCVVLLVRALHRAGHDIDWLTPAIYVWFYGFSLAAMLSFPAFFFYGVWQLVWRPEYRSSWYGWLWLLLMWLHMGAFLTLTDRFFSGIG
jgi:hypothetical protein